MRLTFYFNLCLAGLLLSGNKSQSQKIELIKLSSKPTSIEKISFSRYEVIDSRIDKENIGLIYSGKRSKPIILQFETSLQKLFSRFVDSSLLNKQKNANTLLFQFRKLEFLDKIYYPQSSLGVLKFKATVYLKKDSMYSIMYTMDTLVAIDAQKTEDIKKQIGENINDFFVRYISKASESVKYANSDSYTLKEINYINEIEKANYPINTESVTRKGVYANINEFRNNRPSVRDFIMNNDNPRYAELYYVKENGKKGKRIKLNDIYVAYDGQQLFLFSSDGTLHRIERYGNDYFFFASSMEPERMSLLGSLTTAHDIIYHMTGIYSPLLLTINRLNEANKNSDIPCNCEYMIDLQDGRFIRNETEE